VAVAGPDQTTAASIRTLLDAGEFARAEQSAAILVKTLESEDPSSTNSANALDLLVEASIANGKIAAEETIDLARRAKANRERLSGADDAAVACALHNLGTLSGERGDLKSALALHRRALSLRLGENIEKQALASSWEAVGLTEILLEQFDAARRSLSRAAAMRERDTESAPVPFARSLELQALLNRYTGNYATAFDLLARAEAIRARALPDYPVTISMLDLRGDLFYLTGDIPKAQDTWSTGLTLAQRTVWQGHPSIALFLRKLAASADAFGDREKSRQLLGRAAEIGRHSLPPCHVEVAGLLNDRADSMQRDGEYSEARRLYRRELDSLAACHANANWMATALFNYAGLHSEMGEVDEAVALYERAIRTWTAALGPRHPYVARGIDALAEVMATQGQLSQARTQYERALQIRRRTDRADGPDVAWTLTNLAKVEDRLGRRAAALQDLDKAIAIYAKAGPFDEPDHLARTLELSGFLHAREGDLERARQNLVAAQSERTRIFGPVHPLSSESHVALARVEYLQGEDAPALTAALQAEAAWRDHLRHTIRYLPERQAIAYSSTRPLGLDLAVSIAASSASAVAGQVFDEVIRSRGMILDEFAARARARRLSDPQIASLHATVVQASQRFANLVVRSLDEPVSRALLDEARDQKEEAERAVAEHNVVESLAEYRRARLGANDILAALPADAVLVSFVRYERTVRNAAAPDLQDPTSSYGAFVVRAGASTPIVFVPLGPVRTIDAVVHAWRESASEPLGPDDFSQSTTLRHYVRIASRLRRVIWDPLANYVADARRIFIVPDGLLNTVSLAALPDKQGHFLGEDVAFIHYLSTERDLVSPAAEPQSGRLLAVGSPVFGGSVKAPTASSSPGCGTSGHLHFTDLPGSSLEATEVSRLWPEHGPQDVTLLKGVAATESAVKNALPGRRVIHLATHGFFLSGECRPSITGARGVGGIVLSAGSRTRPAVEENPLLLSGLALAGANDRGAARPGQDDGILTAEEIVGVNLQGTEWAVLSACDTGLGEIKAGESVFGLRRAFQIAGVRTVIMSLWPVDDQATVQWMHELYVARLQKHMDTAESVQAASLAILNARRAKGLSTHPFFWAGFVAAGDWH